MEEIFLMNPRDLREKHINIIFEQIYIREKAVKEMLKILTIPKNKHFYKTFFNIRFDFESIIKFLMKGKNDEYTLLKYNELKKYSTTFFKDYKVFYIEEKIFDIDEHRYFDLFPFFKSSLNNASKKYGFGEKEKSNIPFNNWLWILDNIDIVESYHKQDCKLLSELSNFTMNSWEKLGYIFKNPISLGTLSASNFKKKTGISRYRILDKYEREIENSYQGGMFDIWKRGTFKNLYVYDLNSCYPYIISELLDMNLIRIHYLEDFNPFYDYSYYCCNANFEQPFKATKINGRNFYFKGWHLGFWFTKNEIELMKSQNWKVEIIHGIGINCINKNKPMKKEVLKAYKNRLSFPKNNIYHYLLKIFLNALYGKFKQNMKTNKVLKTFKHSEELECNEEFKKLSESGRNIYIHNFINGMFGIIANDIIHGSIYNILYATEITSNPRLELLKIAYENIDSTVMFNTDSIVSTKKLDLPVSKELGDFSLEVNNKIGTIINNGLYCYYDKLIYDEIKDNNELWDKKYPSKIYPTFYKEASRGIFIDEFDKFKSKIWGKRLLDNLRNCTISPDGKVTFDIDIFTFKHMKSMIKSGKAFMINVQLHDTREININSPDRRNWNRNFETGYDALENNISSEPYNYQKYLDDNFSKKVFKGQFSLIK